MKHYYLIFYFMSLIALNLLTTGCTVCTHINKNKIQGVFLSKGGQKIILVKNKFYYIDAKNRGDLGSPCCDTLSFGTWEIDNSGFLIFNTPFWLNNIFININVKEKVNVQHKDSVYFYINSPLQKQKGFNNEDLLYSLFVQPNENSSDYFIENSKEFSTSIIRFYNPKMLPINNFNLSILPQSSIFNKIKMLNVKQLITPTYSVKNEKTNVFDIDAPKLNYQYLSYIRLEDDYVKIIDENKLRWHGKDFNRD